MSQDNRELARRWMDEVWNQRLEPTIDDMLAPNVIGHAEGNVDIRDVPGFRAYRSALLNAFPNLRIEVEDVISSGDDVAVRWRVCGTHDGDGLGIAATGQPVEFWGMTWLRFSDGRIVEGWDAWNQGGVVQRLQTGWAASRAPASPGVHAASRTP